MPSALIRPAPRGTFSRGAGEGGTSLFDAAMSRAAAVRAMRRLFEERGLDTPGLDARLLVAHRLGLDALALAVSPEIAIGPAAAGLHHAARRRLAHEPVARIIGNWDFYGLTFDLDASTLVPRPETETIVDAALAEIDRAAPIAILDLGTGSGAILVALLSALPRAFAIGVDLAPAAAAIARRNAAANRVAGRAAFVVGDWADAIDGVFDLVVSNPPYIESGVVPTLPEEVRCHDPLRALDGGRDGLDAYRCIARGLRRLLRPGGRAILEIGSDQAQSTASLFAAAGFASPQVRLDLGGLPRVLIVRDAAGATPASIRRGR